MKAKIIYDNIHNLLMEKDIPIGEFEKQVGVSQGYISRMLKKRDTLVISLDICIKMADCLGVTVDDLVRSPLNKALNDIKAEIIQERDGDMGGSQEIIDGFVYGCNMALNIIDKYREDK